MFSSLSKNLSKIFDKIKGKGVITESHIDDVMHDIRIALLEADVALSVVKNFIERIRLKAVGTEIIKSVSPAQMIIKIIHDEIIEILSSTEEELKLNFNSASPVNILMVGLQGSGKTTASAKLALRLKNQNKKILLVSLDTYRPAAQEQLAILSASINVKCLEIIESQKPLDITKRALSESKLSGYDVVIYDTAGRLQIDEEMMKEVSKIKDMIKPTETMLVIDSMTGQDAIVTASNFNEKLGITGIILSRIDGDAKGGAALSLKQVTSKPIKFLSTGEKLQNLELFDAERIASRILDMGDIVSFVENAEQAVDKDEAERATRRLKKGIFDLNDYLTYMRSITKMGGLTKIIGMLPGANSFMSKIGEDKLNSKILTYQTAIILSMTPVERKNPNLLNASRKKRIALGAGRPINEINVLLKQHMQIAKMMKKMVGMDPENFMKNAMARMS
jgi:signal recognition particle subunit SRP54